MTTPEPTPPETPPTPPRPGRFQFSLRGLMVFVLGVAMGLSVWQMEVPAEEEETFVSWLMESRGAAWYHGLENTVTPMAHGLVAAAAAWIVLGLAMQIRDLTKFLRSHPEVSREERWGWCFAAFWRVFVMGLLAVYYGIGALLHHGVLHFAEMDDAFTTPGKNAREALFLVCMIFVLTNVAPRTRPKRTGLGPTLWSVAGVATAMVLAVIVCAYNTLIQFLVAIALQGIESAQSPRFVPEGVDVLPWVRTARFHRESALVLVLALANLAVACLLIRRWARAGPRRLVGDVFLGIGFAASFAVAAAGVVWLFGVAMPRAFPIMIEAQKPWPGHVWASSILLVAVLAAAGAYRLVRVPREAAGGAGAARPAHRRYGHERIAVIALLAVAVAVQFLTSLNLAWAITMPEFILIDIVARGDCLLRLVLLGVAGGAVWRLVRRRGDAAPCPPAVAPSRFAAVWLALFLTSLTLLPAIGVFGFTLWFTRWCTGQPL